MELWRHERESERLIGISESFYGVMRDHLRMWEERINNTADPFTKEILSVHLKRLRYIINDIIDIRTRKIIEKVIKGEKVQVSITREENTFYERLKQIYDIYKKEIFSPKETAFISMQDILGEKSEQEVVEEKIEYVAVRFTKEVEEPIVGLDGKYYGPFKEGDICVLPKENAKGLVQFEIATKIDTNRPKGR